MTAPIKIIGIAGASGAGKSRLANLLFERLREQHTAADIAILSEDAYYRRRDDLSFAEREHINYDHPDALEHDLLIEHLSLLKDGQAVDIPQYDYGQHNRKPESIRFEPAKVILLEGILILNEARLRELMDLKVFVDVPLDICLIRRCRRDIADRGRTMESVLTQYENTVRPMFFEFIGPTRDSADIIVPGGGANEAAADVLFSHLERLVGS